MPAPTFSRLVLAYAPLMLLGFGAGALRTVSQRPGISRSRRRALQASWVVLLLAGVPLWLVLAALLHLW